ncbi:unnamed protein product [Penicillium manginii]
MTRSEGTSQKQAVNHTAPQTDSYPSQEFMKMQHQMMLMQSASYVDPPVGIGWRGTPQTFTPEIDDIIGGRFNQPVASGNFLDPRVCFELSGIGRDDRSAGAVGKSPHQQVPWDVPTPESVSPYAEGSPVVESYIICAWEGCTYNGWFSDRISVWKHIKESHLISEQIECNWKGCDYSLPFASNSTLWRHISTKHIAPNAYSCPQCGKLFSRKDKVSDHRRSVHS